MKSYNVFDVVELVTDDKATILEKKDKNKYKVEVVDNAGKTKGIREVDEVEIKKVIIAK